MDAEGFETWNEILKTHRATRERQVWELFEKGLKILNITEDEMPSLEKVNQKLKSLTGFEGVFVKGLEEGGDFFKLLAEKKFPIGHFIRDKKDLSYTPAPDIVHDLYGHLPFFVDKDYADFCYKIGVEACRYLDRPDLLRQFERFFWFTIEFGLIETPQGPRVFGAGIASSLKECEYALGSEPLVVPFDVDQIRKQEFKIDEMQKKLFILKNPEQLYNSLKELCQKVEKDR